MDHDDLLQRLRDRWTGLGIANPTLPTEADVAAFEARYGVRLPALLRSYFLTVNGTALGRLESEDPDLVSF